MGIPSFSSTEEAGSYTPPAEGLHHAALVDMQFTQSSAGNDMLVGEIMIDRGESAGTREKEYFVLGHPSGVGESRLKNMAVRSRNKRHPEGFQWSEDVDSMEAFALQFVQSPPLRFQIEVVHEFSIETERGWKNDVTESAYNEHEGSKRIGANIKKFHEPEKKAEINADPSGAKPPKKEENSVPSFSGSGDGAPGADGEFEPDDDLPF